MESMLSVLLCEIMIRANLAEYSDHSRSLSWISPERALEVEGVRTRVLSVLSSRKEIDCRQIKPIGDPFPRDTGFVERTDSPACSSTANATAAVSYRCAFKEDRLNPSRKIFIEKRLLRASQPLENSDRAFFEKTLLPPAGEPLHSGLQFSDDIADYEVIRPGLQDYF